MKNNFIKFREERIIIVTLVFSILSCIFQIPSIGQLMLIGLEIILAIVILDFSLLTRKTGMLIKLIDFFTLFSLPLNFNLVRRAVAIDFSAIQIPLIKQLYTIRINNIGMTSSCKNVLSTFVFISVPVIFQISYKIFLSYDRFSTKIREFSLYVSHSMEILRFNIFILVLLSGFYLLCRTLSYVPLNTETSQQILATEFSMWSVVTFILFYPLTIVALSIGLFLGASSIKH